MKFNLVIVFALFTGISIAQYTREQVNDPADLYAFVQQEYGLDHDLVKGIQLYNLYRHVKSHPYFLGEESLPGSVTISGKQFDNVMINYDLYNQWLVLEYREFSGGINKIILEKLHTDGFQIDGYRFEKLILDKNGKLFYQVITADGLTCYIHWKKKMITLSNDREYAEEFSDPFRTFYLEYDGKIYPFSSRRSFASILSGTTGKEARVYMRKHQLRFRRISVEELTGLLNHVSSILIQYQQH